MVLNRTAQAVRNVLGVLQDDPENEKAWVELHRTLESGEGAGKNQESDESLPALLEAARRAHEARREFDAVVRMLREEIALTETGPKQTELVSELARILDEELLDERGAQEAYKKLLELRPGDVSAEDALERGEGKRAKWRDLVARYAEEAKATQDPSFKSSLLVSAREVAYRYAPLELEGTKEKIAKKKLASLFSEIEAGLGEALEIDPKNRRAASLLERIYRQTNRYAEAATLLEKFAAETPIKEEKVATLVRAARMYMRNLNAADRAAATYAKVIDLSPAHAEATRRLVEHYSEKRLHDELAHLYERQLHSGGLPPGQDAGVLLQIAMVHWKMRGKTDAAEPYFDRLRKLEPGHPIMLNFYREHAVKAEDYGRLLQVLTDAHRILPDGPDRVALSKEMATVAEKSLQLQKAIEQWRGVLRQDPGHSEARDNLRRLYRQAGQFPALVELLRGEIDRLAGDASEARAKILREIITVHRDQLVNDAALVTLLPQLLALEPNDMDALRELARVYDTLGRARDLLATQAKLAQMETDPAAKVELYRACARRWLDQFSNVQNAIEAYEQVLAIDPDDREAFDKLRELYGKRRAYKSLYELLEREAKRHPVGKERRALWLELAKLSAERLEDPAGATRLFKQILAESPDPEVLEALEKHAEREKDYQTLADLYDRRVKEAPDDALRVHYLQKLGTLASERLADPERAVGAWREVLKLAPGHSKATRFLRDHYMAAGKFDELTELYAPSNDWENLADFFSAAAESATKIPQKVELSVRAAALYEKIGSTERAVRAHERVLTAKPDHRGAAAALIPIYEQHRAWGRLPPLYEIQLADATDRDDKLAILRKLVIACSELKDHNAAFTHARHAYALDPEAKDAASDFEQAARRSGHVPEFADALKARVSAKKIDSNERADLRKRLAQVLARDLDRPDEAVATLKAAIEDDSADEDSVHALDKLLREEGRRDDLRWLFDIRVSRANTAQKIHLLNEWAVLEEESFGSAEQAIQVHRRVLEIVPEHGGALRSLARLLRSKGDLEGAIDAVTKDRDKREGAERSAREIEISGLYAEMGRSSEALEAAERARELTPDEPNVIVALERLLSVGETRARAATILEEVFSDRREFRKQAEVLEILVATTAAREDRLALYQRLTNVHEEHLHDVSAAFDVLRRAAHEFPSELDVWDRLAVLAKNAHRAQDFVGAMILAVPPTGPSGLPPRVEVDLSQRLATLYADKIGDLDAASTYLRRILAIEPSHEWAFSRLKQIYTTREQWSELFGLYELAIHACDDVRQKELLFDIALAAEEITGNKTQAIGYYERIVDLDPHEFAAERALERLYASEGRWQKLADLLTKQIDGSGEEAQSAIKARLGEIYAEHLKEPARALACFDDVLRHMPTHASARKFVEPMLANPELRQNAARVLEGAYLGNGDDADLVRVLEIRVEAAEGPDKAELLRRIAQTCDERLERKAEAFEAYARLVPLDPADTAARVRLLELSRIEGRHERAAEVLAAAARECRDPLVRGEILLDLARIYDERLNDQARAETPYRQAIESAPSDQAILLGASRALTRLYESTDRKRELAECLRIQAKAEDDPNERARLYAKLAEVCENDLRDLDGAVFAWERRLEEDGRDPAALTALDRLYDQRQNWRALADILRVREELAADDEEKKFRLTRLAQVLADKMAEVDEGIAVYRSIVEQFGADRDTLAAIARLLVATSRWDDLIETLEQDVALAPSEDKVRLLVEIADVHLTHKKSPENAVESLRAAVDLDPKNARAREMLESLLDEPAVRTTITAILKPLYEADRMFERLLRMIDIERETVDVLDERLALYRHAVRVAEESLNDVPRAFGYAALALKEVIGEAEFSEWLATAERLADSASNPSGLEQLLTQVAPEIPDEDVQFDVWLKAGALARNRLSDAEKAVLYYDRALAVKPKDRRALLPLESLHEHRQDVTRWLETMRQLTEVAEDSAERKRALYKQAELSERLGELSDAIAAYEQILDIAMEATAIDPLERLYQTRNRYGDLVSLYERQVGLNPAGNERARLHFKLGETFREKLEDIDRAFDEYRAALGQAQFHAETIHALEQLINDERYAARAGEILEPVYVSRDEPERIKAALRARLRDATGEDRRALLERIARIEEERDRAFDAALRTRAEVLRDDFDDEAAWAELERVAKVGNLLPKLGDIYASELESRAIDETFLANLALRAGEIFEGLQEPARALDFYRKAYAFDPQEFRNAFTLIDRLLEQTEQVEARIQLYREALEVRDDTDERLQLLYVIAELQEKKRDDRAAAIATYRASLDIRDDDEKTLDELERLYRDGSMWQELAAILRHRAERTPEPAAEAVCRVKLADVARTKLNEISMAVDEYEAAIERAPRSQPAEKAQVELEEMLTERKGGQEVSLRIVQILAAVYDRTAEWRKLTWLAEQRLTLTDDLPEKIDILRESARLWEERGSDQNRAFDAIAKAFVLDPEDGSLREDLDRLALATTRWDDLAQAYETGAENADPLTQRELWSSLARLHDQRRDDPRRALEAWDRVLKLDETDLGPLEEMDALATLVSDWGTLVRVLARKAEVMTDDEVRASTWRRVGEARRDMLDDPMGSIEAFERALEIEPESTWTLDNLIALYESRHDAVRLADLYRRRIKLCGPDDDEVKFELLLACADRYEAGLNDRREAIAALNEALTIKPQDLGVVRRLGSLYEAEHLWPEYYENLRLQLANSDNEAEKKTLRKKIGAVLAGHLEDTEQALQFYTDVLSIEFDEEAAQAIRTIGESHEELAFAAADALEPAFRNAGRFADQVRAIELRVRASSEPTDRARAHRAIARVFESDLNDAENAQKSLLSAISDTPSDTDLHDENERVAQRIGRVAWERYASVLEERGAATFDANISGDLYTRLGRVLEERLEQPERAAEALAQAVNRLGDTSDLLLALDRLYARLGQSQKLAEILERRVLVEAQASAQAELFSRLAALQIGEFKEKAHALSNLRSALERSPEHVQSREMLESLIREPELFEDAFEILDATYRQLSMPEKLASLHETRIAATSIPEERARRRLELSRIVEELCKDSLRAQRAIEAALADDPAGDDSLMELRRIAAITGDWRGACEAFGNALSGHDIPRMIATERLRLLGEWRQEKLSDLAGAERAYAEVLRLDPENMDAVRALEAIRRAPGRERELAATLRTRAKLEVDWSTKLEVYREAWGAAVSVDDKELAHAVLRDAHDENEADPWVLDKLAETASASGNHAEAVRLILARAENEADPVRATELKLSAAEIFRDQVGDLEKAVQIYEELMDADPEDARVTSLLGALYERTGQHRSRIRLIERQIDVAKTPADRTRLRLALAEIQAGPLSAVTDAVDTLRAALEEEPGDRAVFRMYCGVLEKSGSFADLADALRDALLREEGEIDSSRAVELLTQLASITEAHLGDLAAAQQAYERLVEFAPGRADFLTQLARIAEKRLDWEHAVFALRALLDLQPNVETAVRLAIASESSGDSEGVENALKRALALDPGHDNARERLAQLFEKSEKWWDLAELLVEQADQVAAMHTNGDAHPAPQPLPAPVGSAPPPVPPHVAEQLKLLRRAADIHLKERQNAEDAVRVLERAAMIMPSDRDLLNALWSAYEAAGRNRDAAGIIERIIESYGNRRTRELSAYHHKLGKTLKDLGDTAGALKQFDSAFKMDPSSIPVLRDLGVLALETNDLERAQKTFRALLLQRLEPSSGMTKGEVFFFLGEISARQGDMPKAVQMFERAIENEPGHDRARDRLSELKR